MPGSPVSLMTQFGCVLAGSTSSGTPVPVVTPHHDTFLSGDELLYRFWEVEKCAYL